MALAAERDGQPESIYWQAADGSGAPERLSVGSTIQGPASWSPDAKRLVFNSPLTPPYDVGLLTLDGERREEMLLTTSFDETNGPVSPDGQRFLMLKDVEATGADKAAPPEMRFVLHWFDELNRLVPEK